MRVALARCFVDPLVTAVIIDPLASNVRAQRFYERLGFVFVERRRFGDDDCFVYRLDRDGYERRNRSMDHREGEKSLSVSIFRKSTQSD